MSDNKHMVSLRTGILLIYGQNLAWNFNARYVPNTPGIQLKKPIMNFNA